jgi:hypothetical protein
MLGRGLYWHHLFADRVQAWIMAAPTADYGLSYVVVDGTTYKAEGPDAVRVEDVEWWTDPRSGFTVPRSWRVTVTTPVGTLSVDAGAYARAYYPWSPFANTWNILYWMPAMASGSFDGTEKIEFRDALYMGHSNRVFFER